MLDVALFISTRTFDCALVASRWTLCFPELTACCTVDTPSRTLFCSSVTPLFFACATPFSAATRALPMLVTESFFELVI
jgi:hypothetical protein